MKALKKRISANIKSIREDRNLSQSKLSSKTGLSIRFISQVENSSPNMTVDKLETFAQGLGVPVSELIQEEKDVKSNRAFKAGIKHCIDILKKSL